MHKTNKFKEDVIMSKFYEDEEVECVFCGKIMDVDYACYCPNCNEIFCEKCFEEEVKNDKCSYCG